MCTEIDRIVATEIVADEIKPFTEALGLSPLIFNQILMTSIGALASFGEQFRQTLSEWHWKMITLSNGAFILEPVPPENLTIHQLHLQNPMNYFDNNVSIPTAGIIATIFSLSHAMERFDNKVLHETYQKVLDYGCQQSESSLIIAAID